jgi:hypothetical protein
MPEKTMNQLAAGRAIHVVDAPLEVQAWADALAALARADPGDWGRPGHAALPNGVITVARLWDLVNKTFLVETRPWSVVRLGLPKLTLPDGTVFGGPNLADDPSWTGPGTGRKPNRGSMWHNALHACLGDFHS